MAYTKLPRLIAEGEKFEQSGQIEDALAIFDRILHITTNDAVASERKAYILVQLKRYTAAIPAIDHALTVTGKEYWLRYLRAQVLWRLKRLEDADEEIDRALDLAPDYVYALLTKCYIARELRHLNESLAAAQHAAELAPDNAVAIEQHAAALYRLKRFEDAIPEYDRAMELNPESESPIFWKGRALSELERHEEALATFEQTVALHPTYADGWRWFAYTLQQLGRNDEALAAYERALQLDDNPDTWHQKAVLLFHSGRVEDALSTVNEALSRGQRTADMVEMRARSLINLERYDEAIDFFDQTLPTFETSAYLLSLMGFAFIKLRRHDDAITAWKRSLERGPDDPLVLHNLLTVYEQQRRYGDMLLPTNRLLAANGKDAKAWAGRICALYCLGQFEAARAASREALRLVPDDASIKTWVEIADRAFHRPGRDGHITLSDGRRMEYAEYGAPDGYPILCCHGTPGSRFDFWSDDALAKQLGLRHIVPDRPNYGLSEPHPRPSHLGWAVDAAELANALGLTRFAVLGVSGGGPYAAACAFKLPERVTGLTLISSPACLPLRKLWSSLGWQARIAGISQRVIPWPLRRALDRFTAGVQRSNPDLMLRLQERIVDGPSKPQRPRVYTPVDLETAAEPFRQNGLGQAWDSRLLLRPWGFAAKDITVPTYVWHGEKDRQAPIMAGRFFAQSIPNCHATFYAGEGHWLLNTHQREIFGAIEKAAKAPTHDVAEATSAEGALEA